MEIPNEATAVTFLDCNNCGHDLAHVGVPDDSHRFGCPGCPTVAKVSDNWNTSRRTYLRLVAVHPGEVDATDGPDDLPESDIWTSVQRRTVEALFVRGYSYEGHAEAEGVTVSALYTRIYDARNALREFLSEANLSSGDYDGFEDVADLLDVDYPAEIPA